MRKLFWTAFAFLMLAPALAEASCANLITSGNLNLVVGGATKHITLVDTTTCIQLGPAGVTFTAPVHLSIVPDATGFVATGLTASPAFPGFETITYHLAGYSDVSVGYAVTVPLGVMGAALQ